MPDNKGPEKVQQGGGDLREDRAKRGIFHGTGSSGRW